MQREEQFHEENQEHLLKCFLSRFRKLNILAIKLLKPYETAELKTNSKTAFMAPLYFSFSLRIKCQRLILSLSKLFRAAILYTKSSRSKLRLQENMLILLLSLSIEIFTFQMFRAIDNLRSVKQTRLERALI